MTSRQRWLREGLEILADSGTVGLTIESLSERLRLSKGSFYHHFGGMPGYRQALLEYFEHRENQEFIDRARAAPVPAGAARVRHIVADAMAAEGGRPRLEAAVRAWASSDPIAREYIDRIDRARVDFLQGELQAMGLEQQAAADFAQIGHLMSIGAADAVLSMTPPQIVRLWDRLLAAAVSAATTDGSDG
ncbi:TetR/AcrR family transcriptional regulator [Lysobacter korlensis]|uniref:TetR/AcrR family transcriptional regulator n=1 Tax=Lysobacter korlensis TaxID=553636 RepID=A0ABV6RZD3_9GAMM